MEIVGTKKSQMLEIAIFFLELEDTDIWLLRVAYTTFASLPCHCRGELRGTQASPETEGLFELQEIG